MIKNGLFDLNEPKDLYCIIHEVYSEYVKHPTERDFLFLVLGLTHLREWIVEGKLQETIDKHKKNKPLTDSERFIIEIYNLESFKVIQSLCNSGKHFITKAQTGNTSKEKGLRPGLGKIGDKQDQLYFLINGRDSREYFIELIHKYNEWFSNN